LRHESDFVSNASLVEGEFIVKMGQINSSLVEYISPLSLIALLLGVVRVGSNDDKSQERKSELRIIKPIAAVLGRAYDYVAVHWDWAGVLALIGGLLIGCLGLALFFLWKEGDTEGEMLLRVIAGVVGFCVPALWILPWAFERLDL
jgi:hypothetical protein